MRERSAIGTSRCQFSELHAMACCMQEDGDTYDFHEDMHCGATHRSLSSCCHLM